MQFFEKYPCWDNRYPMSELSDIKFRYALNWNQIRSQQPRPFRISSSKKVPLRRQSAEKHRAGEVQHNRGGMIPCASRGQASSLTVWNL